VAQCRYCNKRGFFLTVSKYGLCKNCEGPVMASIESIGRVIYESMKIANESKNLNTKIKRLDTMIDMSKKLQEEFIDRGINPLTGDSPQTIIEKAEKAKLENIEIELRKKVEFHLEKARRAQTSKTMISNADKALDELLKFNQEYDYENKELELEIHAFIHKANYEGLVLEAEKFEFKDNVKKAIDKYQEALFFLKRDGIPDEQQQELISSLETKIEELSNNK